MELSWRTSYKKNISMRGESLNLGMKSGAGKEKGAVQHHATRHLYSVTFYLKGVFSLSRRA